MVILGGGAVSYERGTRVVQDKVGRVYRGISCVHNRTLKPRTGFYPSVSLIKKKAPTGFSFLVLNLRKCRDSPDSRIVQWIKKAATDRNVCVGG